MSQELSKVYDPAQVEQKWYKYWEENGYFKPSAPGKPAFTIVIPPPNITGSLHMGHALNNSIQDLLIRYKRMCGFNTLWVPGTDHAGIATQNVVERALKKDGKRKEDLGREKFVEKIWEWKKEYGGKITQQLRRLGSSCDWSRERFTMDDGLSKAVQRHFIQLYNEGLIYRGKRIINWCPRCKTALSDIEVAHETKKGALWHIKYGDIVVATTRPETMLGDTAIAVNPKDERYKHLWGKTVELPLVGRHIPIIKDDFVDPAFGTGAVKVTPAHDPNDYEMGMRHNLPFINIFTPDAHITLNEFSEEEKKALEALPAGRQGLRGLERVKAREEIVKLLEAKGYLVKVEEYENSVGHCYRCKTMIEPYLSDQWFVKVKPLAEKAIAAVEEGKVKFLPERWTKVYLQWMTNLRDWCISRQLWWGHRIPAYYCRNQMSNECNEIIVSETKPEKCPKCGGVNLVQDEDVFDTWFSSALWPFSTLGWPSSAKASEGKPDQTEDLKTFYPTDVLVTSYDIISFWVARMIMAGLHFMKKEPFHTVYIHGLVKDIHGKKMSKSWGNVIDPLDVIDKAGADALRFAFISLIAGQGQDVKLSEDKITEARNFANKIWNAARFAGITKSQGTSSNCNIQISNDLELADKWILSKLNQTINEVTESIETYEFGEAARLLYDFIWSEFCDWYLEIAKIRLYGKDEAAKAKVSALLEIILKNVVKTLHPFMPFITEEIYQNITAGSEGSVMLKAWPKAHEDLINSKVEDEMELVKLVIIKIRNIKAEMCVAAKDVELILVDPLGQISNGLDYIKLLAKASKITVLKQLKEKPKRSASGLVKDIEIYLPLAGLIDFNKEIERLSKEKQKAEQETERLSTLLSNQEFVAKAPKETIASQKAKQEELKVVISALQSRIADLV